MKTNQINATCCKCGSGLKYPVTIGNKIYGSSCASKHLGINDIPENFIGNYDEYKKRKSELDAIEQNEIEKIQKELKAKELKAKKITAKHWKTQLVIGRAYNKAYNMDNDWERGFVSSIAKQLGGYKCYIRDYLKCETFEEVEKIYKLNTSGSYKYDENYLLHGENYRDLDSLSPKQLEILERIEKQ